MQLGRYHMGNFLLMLLLLASVTETNGILKFLLQTLGLDDPPSRPSILFGGWSPLSAPIIRPRRPEFQPRPPPGRFRGNGRPAPTRMFPDVKFRQNFIDTTPSPLFRRPFPVATPPGDNSNRLRPFQIHTDNNALHLSEMLTENPSGDEIKVFNSIRPEILENTLFRFERKPRTR